MIEVGKLHQGLTYEQYDQEPGVRASELKLFMRSPAHFQAAKRKPEKDTEALQFGKLFHSAIENPEKFRDLIRVEPEFVGVTKAGKPTTSKNATDIQDQRKAWLSDQPPGAIIVTGEEAKNLTGMLNSVLNHKLLGNMLRKGVREVSVWADDPDSGLRIKARYDFLAEIGSFPVDFKTTTDARPTNFLNEIFSLRGKDPRFYALHGAHYAHVGRMAKICSGESMTFVAVEKEDPWGVWLYPMDTYALEVGERRRKNLMRGYAKCLKTNEWPNYEERASAVQIPNYVDWQENEDAP